MPSEGISFPAKMQMLFRPKRYKVLYGGRGSAKSWSVARALLIAGTQHPERILCAREYGNTIRDSVHQLLADQIKDMGLERFYDIGQAEITGKNGTVFRFFGLKRQFNEIKSFEGVTKCWVEEANTTSKASWDVLIPTIRRDNSEIWITFNPELETDYTYERFVKNPPENAEVEKVSWQDNPWFPPVLVAEKNDLKARDHDSYLTVWEGHCRQTLDGAIYAKEIRHATEANHITRVPYQPGRPVDTIWDLGRSDYTSVWFRQRAGFEWHYVDFYENCGHVLDHYNQILQNRGYTYGHHYLPHDARAKTIGSKLSVQEQMQQVWGVDKVKITPNLSIADGINAARTMFPNCYFDETRCFDGLQHLRHYRYDVDQRTGQRDRNPLHDEHSHAADAFRYSAVTTKEVKGKPQLKLDTPRTVTVPFQTDRWMQ